MNKDLRITKINQLLDRDLNNEQLKKDLLRDEIMWEGNLKSFYVHKIPLTYLVYNKYNGRRFTAHSGSDSDDFLIYFGYLSKNNELIFSINHERHGVTKSVELSNVEDENGATYFHVPEYKIEFKLDYRTTFKEYDIFFIYEFEYLDNLGIPHQGINPRFSLPKRKSNVFGIGFSKNFK